MIRFLAIVVAILASSFATYSYSQGLIGAINTRAYSVDATLTYGLQLEAGYQLMIDRDKEDEFAGHIQATIGYDLYRNLVKQAFAASSFASLGIGMSNGYDQFITASVQYFLAENKLGANFQVQLYPFDRKLSPLGFGLNLGVRQIGAGSPTTYAGISFLLTNRKKLKQ